MLLEFNWINDHRAPCTTSGDVEFAYEKFEKALMYFIVTFIHRPAHQHYELRVEERTNAVLRFVIQHLVIDYKHIYGKNGLFSADVHTAEVISRATYTTKVFYGIQSE